MYQYELVNNESVCSGSGIPVQHCDCGCNRQSVQNAHRPQHEPLGLPVYNFENPLKPQQAVQNAAEPSYSGQSIVMLPPRQSTTQVVNRRVTPTHTPLGLPSYHFDDPLKR